MTEVVQSERNIVLPTWIVVKFISEVVQSERNIVLPTWIVVKFNGIPPKIMTCSITNLSFDGLTGITTIILTNMATHFYKYRNEPFSS